MEKNSRPGIAVERQKGKVYEQRQSRQRFETVEVRSVNLEGCCKTVLVSPVEKFSISVSRG